MYSLFVLPLLRELEGKLTEFAARGSIAHIDLSRLPMPAGGGEEIEAFLGRGEAEATVSALGVTTIRETAVAGVWQNHEVRLERRVVADSSRTTGSE